MNIVLDIHPIGSRKFLMNVVGNYIYEIIIDSITIRIDDHDTVIEYSNELDDYAMKIRYPDQYDQVKMSHSYVMRTEAEFIFETYEEAATALKERLRRFMERLK